jgi:hypothetical protein
MEADAGATSDEGGVLGGRQAMQSAHQARWAGPGHALVDGQEAGRQKRKRVRVTVPVPGRKPARGITALFSWRVFSTVTP